MDSSTPTPAEIIADATSTYRTNYIGLMSFTILVWDHMITFDDEVEYIWKGNKGPLVYLFLLNRYLTPLGFIVNLFAYLSPVWTPEICRHFVRYEGTMTAIGIEIVGIMMLLRVIAMYKGNKLVIGCVAFLLVVEAVVTTWLLTTARPVPHIEESLHSCTMIFDPTLSDAASASAWIPLLYDTVVLLLTLKRTLPHIRHQEAGRVIKKLLEDGLLYYSVIFCVNLVLTVMIVAAPSGVKNITAQLELLITVAMMSRITLSLRKTLGQGIFVHDSPNALDSTSSRHERSSHSSHSRFRSRSYSGASGRSKLGTLTFSVPSAVLRSHQAGLSPIESLQSLSIQEADIADDDTSEVLGRPFEQYEMNLPHRHYEDLESQRICRPPNMYGYYERSSPS